MNRFSYIHDFQRASLIIVPGSRWKKKLIHRPSPLDMEIVSVSKNNLIKKENDLEPEIMWDIYIKEQTPKIVTISGGSIGYFLNLYEPL
jgi:hypothetical protein